MAQDIESAQSALEAAKASHRNDPAAILEAGFAKLGGKKVRGATPRQDAEPNPDLFKELGGKYVGKISDAHE